MRYEMKRTKKILGANKYDGFHLVPDTAGIISNGVYVKDDGSEVRICFAWGKNLHFRQLKENEISL